MQKLNHCSYCRWSKRF